MWQRKQFGCLSGLNRGEDILKYRRDALLTPESRSEWDRAMALRLGLGDRLDAVEDRLSSIEDEASGTARRVCRKPTTGGIRMPEGVE